jgi:hypothetical protein
VNPDSNPLVQKLAAFVAEGPPISPYAALSSSVGGFEAALAAKALAGYDAAAKSTTPDLSLTVDAASNSTAVGGRRRGCGRGAGAGWA